LGIFTELSEHMNLKRERRYRSNAHSLLMTNFWVVCSTFGAYVRYETGFWVACQPLALTSFQNSD